MSPSPSFIPRDDHAHGIPPAHHRLPAGTRVGRVSLQVANLDRSIAYYESVLGLRVAARTETTATLTSQGDDAPLVVLRARPGAKPVPPRGRLGLFHFAILLPDRAALGRFLAHIGRTGERVGMSDHLVSEAIYLSDPDGLGIEVYADRPHQTWRYEGRQLVMATDPLDVRSVLAAGGSEPWTGMPAGTVMGHVHLSVADVDRAATFYHDGLGFDKTVWSYPGALFFSAGGYHHHLGTNAWAAHAPAAQPDDARLLEWELLVPDLETVRDTTANLSRVGHGVERTEDGIIVHDPWGTAVHLRVA